ncbi:3-carboxy-cis,cis-muconate cycloisomerase [Tritonibacter mobilis]|uniref:3-carboxy-cis,cis-muconate cycloisomerase n=1 Tax=Tritonibacter mobilis F1926 TaxID=1265309 RepID=A0A1B1A3Z1_9RHOB|nr:3-carboxy-cis,cis-muconate cycloisomerase [Tritonibacter mobilis]ANP41217.1 3-carboxy-cis,cis-muconate cycloisomerase [Tritonibacter mobilis F1926]KJZ22869.1 3-carboxy-cis,cis-muconate cycloisomerase [Tritonibacter mobilis]
MNPLTSTNPYFAGLFADDEITYLFSGPATAEAFLTYEVALTRAAAEVGHIKADFAARAVAAMAGFATDVVAFQADLKTDGMAVPGYVRQLKAHVGAELAAAVHPGATSQDLIDTALVLAIRAANAIYLSRLEALSTALEALGRTQGENTLMARTRMQAALPITAGHRITTWAAPVLRHTKRLEALRPEVELLQFGGPVGDRQRSQPHGDTIARLMAAELGLRAPARAWHTERDGLAGYASWLSALTGSLGKIGQDICLMAQQGVDALAQQGGGSSSAMAHKQNPVTAELLVTLALYNAGQLPLMHQAMVHEQERSGAMWTLEWMVLPAMMTCTGAALRLATEQIQAITRIGDAAQPS